jgi:GTP pyrophosphokinase
MPTLNDILGLMSDLTPEETALIGKAYAFAEEAHRPQRRKSGEPYFVHVAAVADILAEMGMDAPTVAAGLLHDVIEDTPAETEDVQREFGYEVANLVDGVTKMERISADQEITEAEYLQKTIHAMNNDVRVILIKIADRLHNMRTLGAMKPRRQLEIAQETLELFAPLATRLGMWQVKSELEDLCFLYLHPADYHDIERRMQAFDQQDQAGMNRIVGELQTALDRYGIIATIQPHPRYFYSIQREMEIKQIPFEETFGVRGLRVIVSSTMHCYQTLGVVHEIWRPVPGKVQDYIAAPKDNFYQSLHTAVFYEGSGSLAVQIRTVDMDHQAKYGIAAYWRLKKLDYEKFLYLLNRRLAYIRSLIEPAERETSPEKFLQTVIENIDSDRIYVQTPRGDILDLPRGSTPIDFAYHIHTEVGHRCRGARVNGKLVPLDYQLQTGERVEILTSARGGPSLEWLDRRLRYVRTNRALGKIRDWFRKQGRYEVLAVARQALDEKLVQMGLEAGHYEILLTDTPYHNLDELLLEVGMGAVSAVDIISRTLDEQEHVRAQTVQIANLPITGANGYNVKLARCCRPDPGDEIIGYITRDAQISIHRADCPLLNRRTDIADRLIPVTWDQRLKHRVFPVMVELRALDRPGIMGLIGNVVAKENVNMSSVHIVTEKGIAVFSVTMEVDSYATLSRVLTKVEAVEGVLVAHRVMVEPS